MFAMIFKCFRRMLQVFQLFLTYVACVLSRCYKSRSGCYTCCEQATEAGAGEAVPWPQAVPTCTWEVRRMRAVEGSRWWTRGG
jgi:hypothetical protein